MKETKGKEKQSKVVQQGLGLNTMENDAQDMPAVYDNLHVIRGRLFARENSPADGWMDGWMDEAGPVGSIT